MYSMSLVLLQNFWWIHEVIVCVSLSGLIYFSLLDKDMHLEEDELLARAIQESLNVESPPRRNGSANGGNTYHPPREPGTTNGGNAYQPLPFMFSSGFRFISTWLLYYVEVCVDMLIWTDVYEIASKHINELVL